MEGRRVIGLAARDESGHLSPYSFTLRKTGPEDVVLKVLYCGVDHTDLHQMRSEIFPINYPLVPGHEVVGEVVELGSEAKKFKLGDKVGVGCMISSCGKCMACESNSEQYCSERILTYGGTNKDGTPTQGGFSSAMVVHQKFVVKIPEKLAPEQAAPLLCAGVTAYSPLKQFYNPDKAIKAEILGLGGVGHLGVLIAKAMGHHVTVISSSENKRVEALEQLGADAFLVSSNAAEMEGAANSLDYILDTVPALHPLGPYISLLKVAGKLIFVGVATKPLCFNTEHLLLGTKSLTGSFIGSMEETQEILDFWSEKALTSMIEVVKADYINKAFEKMERNEVRKTGVEDVMLKVLYCVVDHTDPHQMRSEIQSSNYPLVPGHEVVGEVVELGTEVNGRIFTHGGIDKDGTPTQGGFSSAMVVHRKFVGKIPEKLEPKQAAPLLCAGVTAYSALKQFKNPDKVIKAGILGLGGVGPLGVLIAKTMGHHVTVISSSEKKRMEALEHLRADAFLVSSDAAEM
ncbi:hypothetical protein QUC31_003160 [Theobroma cacao]